MMMEPMLPAGQSLPPGGTGVPEGGFVPLRAMTARNAASLHQRGLVLRIIPTRWFRWASA